MDSIMEEEDPNMQNWEGLTPQTEIRFREWNKWKRPKYKVRKIFPMIYIILLISSPSDFELMQLTLASHSFPIFSNLQILTDGAKVTTEEADVARNRCLPSVVIF